VTSSIFLYCYNIGGIWHGYPEASSERDKMRDRRDDSNFSQNEESIITGLLEGGRS